jgi:hypothetical protein
MNGSEFSFDIVSVAPDEVIRSGSTALFAADRIDAALFGSSDGITPLVLIFPGVSPEASRTCGSIPSVIAFDAEVRNHLDEFI